MIWVQEMRVLEDRQVTSLNQDQKGELRHSKTQMSLQLACWMGHTGQGTKVDVLGIPLTFHFLSLDPSQI